ncbi:MFS transporter [Rhodococcus rhodnii]|uniref:Major facilitator superfamily multidrug n=2 Tax=Rhodococcus rhodnii TaxID=38312 RepID=R7WM96_9NOCA|nr:MFS transporter [Rhodococcus rhodnii]EOM75139.1 major facilitator superfamily multidrug [Rhodococcus rhodnii LMG 5362]TXG89382.1 MFS transporter [Rhodococcus rhodnii]
MTLAPPRATADAPTASRFVFPILAVAGTFQAVLQTVMIPLLPSMPSFTGASTTAVSWLITITLLVGAVVTPIFGRLADMYGKKRMLLVTFTAMTVGSLACAVSSDIAVLICARALQGFGAAVIPVGISMLRDELPPLRVPQAIATPSSTLGVGTAFGVPLAAVIAEYANWHLLFWITTALGLGLLAATAVWIRESPARTGGRFDGLGAVGLSSALVALLVPITQGATWGWTSPAVLGMFAASVVLLSLWAFQQLRARNALVDLRTSVRPAVALPHAIALLVGFAFYGNALVTQQLIQAPRSADGYDLGILLAGLCQLPLSLSMIVFAQVGVRISERLGTKATMLAGALCLLAGYGIHAVVGKPLWLVVVALTVTATGTALAYSTLPLLLLPAVPQSQLAAANGVNVLARTVGTMVCSAVVASLLGTLAVGAGAFSVAYLVCAGLSVLVFVAVLALPRGVRSRGTEPAVTV